MNSWIVQSDVSKINRRKLTLKDKDVQLFFIDVSSICPEAYCNAGWIPQDRIQRMVKYRRESDKKLLIGGELILTSYMSEKLDKSWASLMSTESRLLERGLNEYGKPYFIRHPDMAFNISHSGKYCVGAFSDVQIGVDVQIKSEPYAEIADSFFNDDERKILYALPEDKRADYFFTMWTLKESYMKAVGKGMQISLKDIRENKTSNDTYVISAKNEAGRYVARTLSDFDDEYKLSVCVSR